LTNLASGAAPSLSALIWARFFGGFFSSACFVLGGGIINDVILPEFQGKVMAVYSFGALLSPVFGPMTFSPFLRRYLIEGEDMSVHITGSRSHAGPY
jgi:MFS family permease